MDTVIDRKNQIKKSTFMIVVSILGVIIIALSCILIYLAVSGGIDFDLPDPPLGDFINVRDKGAKGDGTTDDSKAITLAFNEAQTKDMELYFPAGTYNFNNTNLTAKKNIRIFGDGKDSILYNPGQLNCYNDVSLESLSVFKRSGVFVNIKPDAYSNVYVNNVNIDNDLKVSDNCILVYAAITQVGMNKGINEVIFTNNNISKCRSALSLRCEVKSGFVDNNTLTNIGDPDRHQTTLGLTVGNTDSSNNWIPANDVTISNNTIIGVYGKLPEVSSALVYSILAIGNNITIINNHIENQNSYTGIYAKANDLVVSNNTLINAGNRSSIVVKVNELFTNKKPIVIEDNYISSNIDKEGSIRINANYFTVRNNTIELLDNENGILGSAAAIYHSSLDIHEALIEGNKIYTESKIGILIMHLDGHVSIKNNSITQNIMKTVSTDSATAVQLRANTPTSVIDCTDNTITIQRGQFAVFGAGTTKDGGVLNFVNNTVNSPDSTSYIVSPHMLSCNMIDNTITISPNDSFKSNESGKGILTTQATSVEYQIENNDIYYGGTGATSLFALKSAFSMSNNRIHFQQGSDILTVVNYAPAANAAPRSVSVISNNTIGEITDVLSGISAANTDYLVQLNSAGSYTYPELDISENSAIVNLRLVGRSNTSKTIASIGSIKIADNLVYSVLNNIDAAVIDLKVREPNLTLGANTSLSDYVVAMSEAEKAAQAEADRLAAEAERLAEETARLAEEAALKEAEAARLAAEAELAAQAIADEAAREAEAAAQAAAEAAEQAAVEAAAREAEAVAQAAAEAAAQAAAEAAAQAAAQAEEEAKLAAEAEAARLAAEAEAIAATKAAAEEAARLAAEQAEAERLAAEQAARIAVEEAARVAAEQSAASKLAAEQAIREAAKAAQEAIAAAKVAVEAMIREAAARAAALQAAARLEAERVADQRAAEEAERLAMERIAAQEEADRIATEEAARIAREEEAKLAAEKKAAEEAEAMAAKAAADEALKIEAESLIKQAEADENESIIIPTRPDDFTFYATKDGYLILQFTSEVKGASNKCVTIGGKTYTTKQYDKNSMLVDVDLNSGQLSSSFEVTVKVIISAIDARKVQTITKTLIK